MITNCPNCTSARINKKGRDVRHGTISQRYKCKMCHTNFYDTSSTEVKIAEIKIAEEIVSTTFAQTWVITSAVSDTPVNKVALDALINYCRYNDAELLIVPLKYKLHGLAEADSEYTWAEEVQPYLINKNIRLTCNLTLLAGVRVSPAIANPLIGFDSFSKGDSLIIGHPQIAMKTIAVSHVDSSAMMATTGCVTEPIYTQTKQGSRAIFNHSLSAVVIEKDGNDFHYRVLHTDEDVIYDLDKRYADGSVALVNSIPALIIGDEHIIHVDESVTEATFTDMYSMVNVLRPEFICRHDSLDFYSGSHHHKHNVFTNYAKHHSETDNIENELKLTIDYIIRTTPEFSKSVIIGSNHNGHLLRWLNECNPKTDPRNSALYHELMYLMLSETKMGDAGSIHPDPLELWTKHNYANIDNIRFLSSSESFIIKGIELALHGHQGANGSRGNVAGFSKLAKKTITGHSHSPAIFEGAYSVGHSCKSKLEYNSGPSSWAHCHVLIYENGKRTPIFIKNGRWRANR